MRNVRVASLDEHASFVRGYASVIVLAAATAYIPRSIDVPHRVLHGVHLMAPTCGLGRAGRALLRLDVAEAIAYNPAILAVALLSGFVVVRQLSGWMTDRWITLELRPGRSALVVAVAAVVALAAWQQYRYDVLTGRA